MKISSNVEAHNVTTDTIYFDTERGDPLTRVPKRRHELYLIELKK